MSSVDNLVTAVVTTSPIPSHPSPAIMVETITRIQHHLPDVRILILVDGVRAELSRRRQDYEEYLDRLRIYVRERGGYRIDLCLYNDQNEHWHQTRMLANALHAIVDTPLILFSEHDLPLFRDRLIDWTALADSILYGPVDLVRLMLQPRVHPEHTHLMFGYAPDCPAPLLRTMQFSGWTHLASTAKYREWLRPVTPAVNCYLEPYMQGVVERLGWDKCRLSIYLPGGADGDSQRIYHTDGRQGDPQYLETQKYG